MEMLYDVIKTITTHPGPYLYLGEPSVKLLYAYLGGFLHNNDAANDHCLDGFHEYVAKEFGLRTTHNWAQIIEFFSATKQDEIQLFTKLFDDFLKSKTVGGWMNPNEK